MSGSLKLTGVDLPGTGYQLMANMVPLALPVSAGLVGLYQFGGSEAASLLNNANAALPLTKIGAPVVGNLGVTASRVNCFDTGILETSAFTFIAVAKPRAVGGVANPGGMLVSNFPGGSSGPRGVSLGFAQGTANAVSFVTSETSTIVQTPVSLAGAVPEDWNLFSSKSGSGQLTVTKWSKSGVIASANSATVTGRTLRDATLKIGGHDSSDSTAFPGTVDLLAVAIYNTRLSDADETANMAAIRTFYAENASILTL